MLYKLQISSGAGLMVKFPIGEVYTSVVFKLQPPDRR
jgi:hypothetical protein